MQKILVTIPVQEHTKTQWENTFPYTFLYTNDVQSLSESDRQEIEIVFGEITKEIAAQLPNLKWVQLFSAGANTFTWLPEEVTLTNAYGSYGPGIGEYLVSATLMAIKNFPDYILAQEKHEWKALQEPRTISSLKVLSIGMGSIGSAYLKTMHSLGATCYGVCRSEKEMPDYVEALYTPQTVDEILPSCDVVALSLPETPDTIHFLNQQRLDSMKDDAILLNVGRGSAIDSEALVKCLKKGKFHTVILDVTEPEPLPKNHPLWNFKNVVITPHVSGRYTSNIHYEKVIAVVNENLKRYMANEDFIHTVSKTLGY